MKTVRLKKARVRSRIIIYVDSLASLIAGVQMGVLEFHIWGCRRDRLEQPDRLVFDLDPDEALGFARCARAPRPMCATACRSWG